MYRIGIMERSVEFGTRLESWFLEYGEKMRLPLEICRWKFEDELMAALDENRIPDILFLEVGDKVADKEQPAVKRSIWAPKPDGRTREAQLHHRKASEDGTEGINRAGIALGKKLRERLDCTSLQLIYIAPRRDFYEGLVQTQPMDLLIEPLTEARVHSSLRKAIAVVKNKNERFYFKWGKDSFFLPLRDILYICSDCRKLQIKVPWGEYEYNGNIKDVKGELPEEFLTIHRSYIINKNHVKRYEYEYLEMMDGMVFSISRPNRPMVRQILLDR